MATTDEDLPDLCNAISSSSGSDSSDSMVGLRDVDDSSSDDSYSAESDEEFAEQKEADDVIELDVSDVAEDEHEDSSDGDEEGSLDVVEQVDEHEDSSDGDDEDSDYNDESAAAAAPAVQTVSRPSRSTSNNNPVYVGERVDQHFNDGRPGYTHFHRTRKGGDVRPNGTELTLPKAIQCGVTIHNFFCAPGENCFVCR